MIPEPSISQFSGDQYTTTHKLTTFSKSISVNVTSQPEDGIIAGVDEAGRGPLAGPVVAAAVILPPNFKHKLYDSKAISANKREHLFNFILSDAIAVGLSFISPMLIDQLNIRRASLLAMRIAVEMLDIEPKYILIDGRDTIPGLSFPQEAVVKGDAKIPAISAASIIAKVSRDNFMRFIHPLFSCYNFPSHKGYPTKKHIVSIKQFGSSPVHRKTFRGVT